MPQLRLRGASLGVHVTLNMIERRLECKSAVLLVVKKVIEGAECPLVAPENRQVLSDPTSPKAAAKAAGAPNKPKASPQAKGQNGMANVAGLQAGTIVVDGECWPLTSHGQSGSWLDSSKPSKRKSQELPEPQKYVG